jgi:hypothetical protein
MNLYIWDVSKGCYREIEAEIIPIDLIGIMPAKGSDQKLIINYTEN